MTLLLPSAAFAQMSKSDAVAQAKRQYKGKVLSVKLVNSQGNRNTYKVKILLPDGRVKTVTVSG